MKIGARTIRPDGWDVPYLIAEIGVAHEGHVARAHRLIELAAQVGADAVKFQVYTAHKLAAADSPTYFHQGPQAAKTQREFFQRYDALGPDDYRALKQTADRAGVAFLATPFDLDCLAWLDPLVPAWKVASGDITNLPLLEAVARTGKPIILSTGASHQWEMEIYWPSPTTDVALLHCVLSYPTAWEDANLGAIATMRRAYPETVIGWSDHVANPPEGCVIPAWLVGARIIEKHFTDDRDLPGNDHYHSWTPDTLRDTVARLKDLQAMIGHGRKEPLPCEAAARREARRSVYYATALPAGHVLAPDDLVTLRPGHGVSPMEIPRLVGQVLAVGVGAEQAFTWDHLARLNK